MRLKKRYIRYLVKPVSWKRKLRVIWWNIKHILQCGKHPLWGPYPTYAKIEIDQRCNLRCIYCFRESGITDESYMTLAQFKEVVDKLGLGICEVYPHGFGESMRNPFFFEMMEHLNEKGIMWSLATNGTYINDTTIPRLLELEPTNIRLSIDAADKKTFESIRIGASYDRVIGYFKKLIDARNERFPEGTKNRPLVTMYCVLCMDTLDQIGPMIELKEKVGADHVSFSDLAWNNDFKASVKEKAVRQVLTEEELQKMFDKYTQPGVSFTFQHGDRRECAYPKMHIYVHANGDVWPCTCTPGFEPPLFNIYTDVRDWKHLYKLYNDSDVMNSFREKSLAGNFDSKVCRSCLQWGTDLCDVI